MPLNTTFYHHMGIYPTWLVNTSKNTAKMVLVAYARRECRLEGSRWIENDPAGTSGSGSCRWR